MFLLKVMYLPVCLMENVILQIYLFQIKMYNISSDISLFFF